MTTLTDEQVVEQRNDLEMLKRPHLWPGAGRTINLKQRDPEAWALCQRVQDGSYRVWRYKGFTYDLEETPLMFADAEAVVDAGWEVD